MPRLNKTPYSRKTNLKAWSVRLLCGAIFIILLIIFWYSYDLPSINSLTEAERKPSITMLTRDGDLLSTYGDLYGNTITLNSLPKHIPQAVVAIEDHRFYSHIGIDFFAFGRASYNNIVRKQVVQGGSSITQQLAKNFLLSQGKFHYTDRSMRRKVQELFLSAWLEYQFTKNQILSIYLNRIDFGAGVYGFDAAAQRYFFKQLHELSVFESAILAGMLKAPTRYNPLRHPQDSAKRAEVVIQRMVSQNFISQPAANIEIKLGKDRLFNRKINTSIYRYFTDWVMDSLPNYLGHIDKDLVVVTSLNIKAQAAAHKTVRHVIDTYSKDRNLEQMALISMSTNGEILAMIGGENYAKSPFNRATQALRQPGSAFKPFVYIAAFENGFSPTDVMNDKVQSYGKWAPKNIYNQYRGDLTLEDALAYSSNTITVKLLYQVGVKPLVKLARRLGIKTRLAHNLTLALGSGEVSLFNLTSAYGVIANGGCEIYPHGIIEIRDKNTNKTLYRAGQPLQKRLLKPEVSRQIDQLLTSAVKYGTSKRSKLQNNIPSAGKSGTSQQYRDGWFVGYVKQSSGPITGIWIGNDNYSPTKRVVGGMIPAEAWKMYHDEWVQHSPHSHQPARLEPAPTAIKYHGNSALNLLEPSATDTIESNLNNTMNDEEETDK